MNSLPEWYLRNLHDDAIFHAWDAFLLNVGLGSFSFFSSYSVL